MRSWLGHSGLVPPLSPLWAADRRRGCMVAMLAMAAISSQVLASSSQLERAWVRLKEIKQLLELTRDGQRPCEGVRELARRNLVAR